MPGNQACGSERRSRMVTGSACTSGRWASSSEIQRHVVTEVGMHARKSGTRLWNSEPRGNRAGMHAQTLGKQL
jgi:hypothetical protein